MCFSLIFMFTSTYEQKDWVSFTRQCKLGFSGCNFEEKLWKLQQTHLHTHVLICGSGNTANNLKQKTKLFVLLVITRCERYRICSTCSITPQHVLQLFTSFEGSWNIHCGFGLDTVTPHHPFLTWSAFHLWMVMFTLLLAWRQSFLFTAHIPVFLFLELSVDEVCICVGCLLVFLISHCH